MTRRPPSSPSGPGAPASAGELARRIQHMTRLLRNAAAPLMAQRPPAEVRPDAPQQEQPRAGGSSAASPGWWVLAQGRELDPQDFAEREAAREELLQSVLQRGVLPGENVWVWDETGRAQLVLATLPSLERARRVAERLRAKGLAVIVRRAMPESPR